jgi:hypothetical protein
MLTRTTFIGLAAGAMVCLAAAVPGQSLGDVAKRTEEQRRERPGTAKTFTNADLVDVTSMNNKEVVALELTMPMLDQYFGIRTAILREMVKSPDLTQRMKAQVGTRTAGVAGLERDYAGEPAVAAAIGAGHMTTHEYVITEVAFMAAVGVLAGKLPPALAANRTIGGNVEFLKRHEREIEAMHREAGVLEERLSR